MSRIVPVTGAAGALGRRTTEVLGGQGWTIAGIDRAAVAAGHVALTLGGVDITDADAATGW
jgi:nucleoside-diphosphate-sugar epimerase